MRRSTAFMLGGLLLGSLPLAKIAVAASPFDGTYGGMMRQTQTNGSGQCQNLNRPVQVPVQNGQARFHWGEVPLEASVGADGSFSQDRPGLMSRGASATVSFKGRITGANLEADVGNTQCAVHLSLKKM